MDGHYPVNRDDWGGLLSRSSRRARARST